MSAEDQVPDDPEDINTPFKVMERRLRQLMDHEGPIVLNEDYFAVLDEQENERCRLGKQADGTYGLRVWDTNGSMTTNLTTSP